jgi:hypothetical protein
VAGCCEYVSEAFGWAKGREFLDQLSDYQLLKDASSQRSRPSSASPKHKGKTCLRHSGSEHGCLLAVSFTIFVLPPNNVVLVLQRVGF